MSEIAPDRHLRLQDLPDTNTPEQDRQQLRQQVADALGVAASDISVELVGTVYRASVQGQAGSFQLDWADSQDFERIKAGSATPCLFGFGARDETLLIGRLMASSEDWAFGQGLSVLSNHFRAALSRELHVPVRQLELRVHDDHLQVRAQQGGWQTLSFAHDQEGERLLKQARKQSTTAPIPLAEFGRSQDDTRITLPALAGKRDSEIIASLQHGLAAVMGVPPRQILLSAVGGQLTASVIPDNYSSEALSRLTAPFRGTRVYEVQTESPGDLNHLLTILSTSRSPRLSHLGQQPNTHSIRIPHYPPDLGRDQEIERFRDDVTRAMGTAATNIEVFLNEDGLAQARVSGNEQLYDLRFTAPQDFARFSRYLRENPGMGLDTLGQRRLDHVVDLGAHTGWPAPQGHTGFTESVQSRVYLDEAGHHQLRLGVDLGQDLDNGPTQGFRLGYHHRQFGGLDVLVNHNHEGAWSISAADAESSFLTQAGQRFWGRLQHGEAKAWAITGGTLLGVAGSLYAASRLIPETQRLDLPVDADVLNTGSVKVGLGVSGQLRVGGDDLGYDFHGVRGNVRENIASGVNASQRLSYDIEHQQLGLQTQTTIKRFNMAAESSYDFANRQFGTTKLALSQNFPLSDRLNLTLGAGGSLNGDWRVMTAQGSSGLNYNAGDVWTFGVGTNVGWSRDPVGKVPGQTPVYGLDLRVRAHF